ncbi:MAG: hypothetical protein OXG39_02385 [Chloroflexi bacterium]|nr:hypothetical protein [Chloroflexota bacterium]
MAWTTPKTDWSNGELVTAEDMNAIGENLATLQGPSAKPIATYTTTQDTTGERGAFADVDSNNLNLTIVTTGGDVLVHFHGFLNRTTGNDVDTYFDVSVDGNLQGNTYGVTGIRVTGAGMPVAFTRLVQGLSVGSHTFKLKWRHRRGGGSRLLRSAQFWVREI